MNYNVERCCTNFLYFLKYFKRVKITSDAIVSDRPIQAASAKNKNVDGGLVS